MEKQFAELTAFLPKLAEGEYGAYTPMTGKGTEKDPCRMPSFSYSDTVRDYMDAVYAFCKAHPEYRHTDYMETIDAEREKRGWKDPSEADVNEADAKLIIALLIFALRAEHFCNGALLGYLESGAIRRWLQRLKELDGD